MGARAAAAAALWHQGRRRAAAAARAFSHPAAATELAAAGKAARCQLGPEPDTHSARRWVWHHILPQVCGGKTTAANLAELCDSCHYAVHNLMWMLARGQTPAQPYTAGQMALARQGYQAAVAAGTVAKIPKEG